MEESAGWVLDEIENVHLKVSSYKPIRGSCHIDTLSSIKYKRALINVENEDDRCFEYAIIASEFPPKYYKHLPSNYINVMDELNTKGIEMPMRLKDISKFEKKNEY